MAEVESFTLDHNKVIAPYVRKITEEVGEKGDRITNFDIRFLQPNKQEMPTGVIHTFEHLLADLLRDRVDGIIDISIWMPYWIPFNYMGNTKCRNNRCCAKSNIRTNC